MLALYEFRLLFGKLLNHPRKVGISYVANARQKSQPISWQTI